MTGLEGHFLTQSTKGPEVLTIHMVRAAIKEGDSGKGESKEDIFFLY